MERHHKDYYSKVQGSFLARIDFDPQTKLILINLIGRSGIKTWTCSPAHVSKETGIPLRTVSRRFEVLTRMGVLEYVGKEEVWGTRFNKYNINRETLAAVTQTVAGGLETVATDTQTVAAVSRTAISKIKKEEPELRNKKKDEYKEDIAAVSRPPAITPIPDPKATDDKFMRYEADVKSLRGDPKSPAYLEMKTQLARYHGIL